MMTARKLLPLALLLSWSACTCESEQAPERTPQPAAASLQERLAEAMPIPPGDLVALDKMGALLPDELAGFTASAPVDERQNPIANGGTLNVVHREYQSGDLKLQVEITDSLQAPAIANIMKHQHTAKSPMAANVEPQIIRGRPALTQLAKPTKTAIANVLVRNRMLVNIKVSKTEQMDRAIAVADAINYEAIAALLPDDAPRDEVAVDPKALAHQPDQANQGEQANGHENDKEAKPTTATDGADRGDDGEHAEHDDADEEDEGDEEEEGDEP